jgi:hypothetical protein
MLLSEIVAFLSLSNILRVARRFMAVSKLVDQEAERGQQENEDSSN